MTEDRLQKGLDAYTIEQDKKRLADAAYWGANHQLRMNSYRFRVDEVIIKARYEKKRTAYLHIHTHDYKYMRELCKEYAAANIKIKYSWWSGWVISW